MILFYVDESGTGFKDKQSPYFVLSAVGIPINEWHNVDTQITALKRQMVRWAKPEDFEIKGRDMRRGEKFFKGIDWSHRVTFIHDVAKLIAEISCYSFVVQVDKRDLPEYVASDEQMYRLSLPRLLDEIENVLIQSNTQGMLMFDARSDLHSSVQDRRVVDAYRDRASSQVGKTQLIELPWFGFSAFYAGLQIADFTAYVVDFVGNEESEGRGGVELREAFNRFQHKVKILRIP